MATESPFLHDGSQTIAAADLSTKQFFGVKLSAARAVNLVAASTDYPYGILQNKPTANLAADVGVFGVMKAVAGATVTAGAKVMFNASGQVINWVSGAGNVIIGQAIEAAVVNQIMTIMYSVNKVNDA